MPIDVQIRANADQANVAFKRFTADTEKEAARVAARTKERFKDMAVNISQNFSGSASQIVGGLGRIPGAAGLAVSAVIGLSGAFLRLAQNAAEATKETSSGSRSFLTGMENLKTRVQDNINLIGAKAISVFNSFFDLIGVGATKQQILNAETKAYNDLLVATVKKTDDLTERFKTLIKTNDQIDIATTTQDYFTAVSDGNDKLARAYAQQVINRKILQVETKNAATNEQKLLEENKREFERIEKEKAAKRKELAEDIMGTLKKLEEAERDAMRAGLDTADRALQRDRTAFQEELERQRAGLKSPEDVQRAANDAENKRKDILQEQNEKLREQKQIYGQIINSVIGAATSGRSLAESLGGILQTFVSIIAAGSGVSIPFFGANGIIAMQHGSIVRRPTRALIGEAGPEAVVPLSPSKAPQRDAIMQAAGLTNNNVSVTISMPNVRNIDPVTLRSQILPEINRQIRRGERLFATKVL